MSEAASLKPAFVLHHRRYQESSLIVELFTPNQGRIGVLAKGALGGKTNRSGSLQPFTPLLVDWRGRGQLPTLTHCDTASSAISLKGKALYCAMYLNELILKMTEPQDAHERLFASYTTSIELLANTDDTNDSLEPILRRFECLLLDELGLGLSLTHDQDGKPLQSDLRYQYDIELGPRLDQAQSAVMGSTLLALDEGRFESLEQRREARALMRRVIDWHLQGAELKSRELFR